MEAQILDVVTASGLLAAQVLKRQLRASAFDPDQPRDDHGMWTASATTVHEDADKVTVRNGNSFARAAKAGNELHITDVYVRGEQRQGLGTHLVNKLREHAQDRSVSTSTDFSKAGTAFMRSFVRRGEATKHPDGYYQFKKFRGAAEPTIRDWAFDHTDPHTVQRAKDHAAELVKGVSQTTRDELRDILGKAFEADELDAATLVEKLAAELGGDEARAELIARTETMRASNEGQQEAWDQAVEAGFLTGDEQQVWITTPDERVCPICEPMDGETVGLDEPFEVDGEEMDGPPAHPNCRCTVGLQLATGASFDPDQPRDDHGMWTHDSLPNEQYDGQWTSTSNVGAVHAWSQLKTSKDGNEFDQSVKSIREQVREGKLTLSDGALNYLISTAREELKTKFGPTRSVEDARADRLGKTKDSTGRSKARRFSSYNEDEPRDTHGQWTGGKDANKQRRAIESFKPSTKAKHDKADEGERIVARMTGGERTGDNAPVDQVVRVGTRTHGIEVKTFVDNTHDKITMHPSSQARKEKWARRERATLHTVLVDLRGGSRAVYYRRGVGSFRMHTMTRVSSAAHLRKLMVQR